MSFVAAMIAAGLRPRDVVADGRWRRCYDALIAKRIGAVPDGYNERHHIVPRALGGSDDASNLVRLTAREHFIAHMLLAKIHGGVMWVAILRMKGRRHGEGYVNSRFYERARIEWAKWSSENQRGGSHWAFGKPSPMRGIRKPEFSGEGHPLFGTKRTPAQIAAVVAANTGAKRTEKTRQKIAEAQRGERNHMFGKSMSDETRSKISASLSDRRLSDEHKQRISAALKGRTLSDETRRRLSEAAKRRTRSACA